MKRITTHLSGALAVVVPLCLFTLTLGTWTGCAATQPGASGRHSAEVTPSAVLSVMKQVADWQLVNPSTTAHRYTEDAWTWAAFYAGTMALADVADTPKYHDAMVAMGNRFDWKPAKRIYHADDHCVSQTYLELYFRHRDPKMLQPTKERFDYILANRSKDDLNFEKKGTADRYWWCDALFMGPPAWVRLYAATGDNRYLQFVDEEWWATSDYLYDQEEHLYFRDSRYFDRREGNGKKVFWSRGNGWVIAGLARVLQVLPPNHPTRGRYEQQYKEMAAKIAQVQQPTGLWTSSLLDPESYPLKETSGSGFYTFALAWGINRGILDRTTYEPVVRKSWAALVSCVTPEGKLEHVQPVGADPKSFDPTHSDVFGIGAFLLAGSEMYRLALNEHPPAAYANFFAQRMDDFAWENDRIAFRMYGPALEATGEISSGIDVWAKRTPKTVIEKWFYGADYHTDHGEGLDYYKVGPTRGCGAPGIWRDGKLHVANNFLTWQILTNGPKQVTFELGYAPYSVGDIRVTETRRISLEAGSNLNRIETRFDWEGGPDELQAVVGIVKREGGGAPDRAQDGRWMTYWEPAQANNGMIGGGVVLTSAAQAVDMPDQAFLRTTVKRGQTLVYYAGAGWTKSGHFPDKDSWVSYVSRFSNRVN